LPFDFIVPAEECAPLGGEVPAVAPVHVHGHVTNTGESMLVQGEATGEFALVCARCLKPIRARLRADLEERFRRQAGGGQHRVPEWKDLPALSDEAGALQSYGGERRVLEIAVR